MSRKSVAELLRCRGTIAVLALLYRYGELRSLRLMEAARRYGVGKTALLNSLRALRQIGLVTYTAGEGAYGRLVKICRLTERGKEIGCVAEELLSKAYAILAP